MGAGASKAPRPLAGGGGDAPAAPPPPISGGGDAPAKEEVRFADEYQFAEVDPRPLTASGAAMGKCESAGLGVGRCVSQVRGEAHTRAHTHTHTSVHSHTHGRMLRLREGTPNELFMNAPAAADAERDNKPAAADVGDWTNDGGVADAEEDTEQAVAHGPAQELVWEVRRSVREQGVNLLQALRSGGAGGSERDELDLEAFQQTLRAILGSTKHGLVQRGAEELFETLDPERTGRVPCASAADALAVDLRGNPLRTAGQSRGVTGGSRPLLPSAHAGAHQDTTAAATAGASAAGWTLSYLREQLELAHSQLRKLEASKGVLQRESDEAHGDVLHNRMRFQEAKTQLASLTSESSREERSKIESEVRRAETDLDRAESRVEEKQDRRAFVEEELVNIERWRQFLHLQVCLHQQAHCTHARAHKGTRVLGYAH